MHVLWIYKDKHESFKNCPKGNGLVSPYSLLGCRVRFDRWCRDGPWGRWNADAFEASSHGTCQLWDLTACEVSISLLSWDGLTFSSLQAFVQTVIYAWDNVLPPDKHIGRLLLMMQLKVISPGSFIWERKPVLTEKVAVEGDGGKGALGK